MSKVYSGRVVETALCNKGFLKESDGDHIRYFLPNATETDWIVRTKMSHGMKGNTLDLWLCTQMARQLYLTKKQFSELIDCTLTEEEYRKILSEQGVGG